MAQEDVSEIISRNQDKTLMMIIIITTKKVMNWEKTTKVFSVEE